MQRRTDDFRAYYENMPLRRSSIPRSPGISTIGGCRGKLANFHMLDTRQSRDDQAWLLRPPRQHSHPGQHRFHGAWDGCPASRDRVTDGYDEPTGQHYRCVPTVREQGAAAFTRATLVVEDKVRGMRQTYGDPSGCAAPSPPAATRSDAQKIKDTLAAESH